MLKPGGEEGADITDGSLSLTALGDCSVSLQVSRNAAPPLSRMPQCRSSTPCLCCADAPAEACGTPGLSGAPFPFPSHQLPSAAPFLQSVAVSATCQCLGGDEPLLYLPEASCSLVDVARELTRWRGGLET